MGDGNVNRKGPGGHGPQEQISGAVTPTRNGNLQLGGPNYRLGQGKEAVSQVVVPPISTIARAAKGMVAGGIHGLAAAGARGAFRIGGGTNTEA